MDGRSPVEVRRATRESKLAARGEPEPVAQVEDMAIDRPQGRIPVRVYRSVALEAQEGTVPSLVFFHGGGWMMGDLDTHDQLCRRLANRTGGTIVAVDYRLAPEHRFPTSLEDALSSVEWAGRNCRELGVDPARISVGGDSAGANLAAVVALADRGADAVRIHSQILFYPALDLTLRHAASSELDESFPLTYSMLKWFRSLYLRDERDMLDWRASPLLASCLQSAPPTILVTARHDPLYREAFEYAGRLQDSDVNVVHLHFGNQCHGFLNRAPDVRGLNEAIQAIASAIRYIWQDTCKKGESG